ncbi:MAG: hypothetical protein LC689_18675 [Myxococcales bacterium]|nr:hypothetical protein [Myxococcales bacterium]
MRHALQRVGPNGAFIPCLVAESEDRPTVVMCDGSGSWDEGELGAQLAVPHLLDRLRDDNGSLLDATVSALNDVGRAIAPRLTPGYAEGATFATIVARLSPTQAELVSAGGLQALHLRDGKVIARTRRQLLVEVLLEEGKLTPEQAAVFPQRHIQLSSVSIRCDGTVVVGRPIAERWPLERGDVVVVVSDRLADRLSGLDGSTLMRLIDGGWRAEMVAALPLLPEHDDDYRWSERRYSTVTLWS